MTKDELLQESVTEKFQRYVKIDTQSSHESKTTPSTRGQLVLAELLRTELAAIGLTDARVDKFGFVHASVPGNTANAPVIGFLAHLDTATGVSGRGVKPILHRGYGGGDLVLPGARIAVSENPILTRLIGHDLITSDGTTLLGADDKAGVAEIMTMVCRLVAEPELPHGPVKIAFTPDEEIGLGIQHFDVAGFDAACAYTVDGGEAGELEEENFNAENLRVTITGINTHPGSARGLMVNAITAAAELVSRIPAGMRPETTDGRLGFLHVDTIEGDVERVTMRCLLRDFTAEGITAQRGLLRQALRHLTVSYPGLRTRVAVTGSYRNMRAKLAEDPRIMVHAREALTRAGLIPIVRPIRGGTDGARLAEMGLRAPNLFAGGINFHSRREFISIQWMEQAVAVLLHLAEIWAGEKA